MIITVANERLYTTFLFISSFLEFNLTLLTERYVDIYIEAVLYVNIFSFFFPHFLIFIPVKKKFSNMKWKIFTK